MHVATGGARGPWSPMSSVFTLPLHLHWMRLERKKRRMSLVSSGGSMVEGCRPVSASQTSTRPHHSTNQMHWRDSHLTCTSNPCRMSLYRGVDGIMRKKWLENQSAVSRKTEKELSDILTNGVTSSNLQMELSVKYGQNSPSIIPDVQNSSTGDGHSLSNGYSESCAKSVQDNVLSTCLQSTDTEEHYGLDVSIADVLGRKQLINQTDNLPDSNNQSSHKEESEPGETETRLELSGDSQSFTSSGDAQEAEGEQDQMENFVVCGDADCLDRSADSVDIAETEPDPSVDVDLISDTQLSGDTREIHGSSVKPEVEVNEEVETHMDPTADEEFGDFGDALRVLQTSAKLNL